MKFILLLAKSKVQRPEGCADYCAVHRRRLFWRLQGDNWVIRLFSFFVCVLFVVRICGRNLNETGAGGTALFFQCSLGRKTSFVTICFDPYANEPTDSSWIPRKCLKTRNQPSHWILNTSVIKVELNQLILLIFQFPCLCKWGIGLRVNQSLRCQMSKETEIERQLCGRWHHVKWRPLLKRFIGHFAFQWVTWPGRAPFRKRPAGVSSLKEKDVVCAFECCCTGRIIVVQVVCNQQLELYNVLRAPCH